MTRAAKLLRSYRNQLDISVEELARRADCSTSSVQRLERGDARPLLDVVGRVVRALQLSAPEAAEVLCLLAGYPNRASEALRKGA